MERRDEIILRKVLSEIDVAKQMMGQNSFTEFESNELLKRAICMTVINIGELVKNLSDSCRSSYPDVPWQAISGFRDIAAHKYQTLRMEDVYETIIEDFPNLYIAISHICEEEV